MIRRAVVAGLAALAACGAPAAEKLSQPEAEAAVAKALPELESIRGLAFMTKVPVTVVDDEKARAYALARFRKMTPDAKIASDGKAYELLGLVPQGVDILKTMLDVLEEQAGGFYDPTTKSFYLLDDMPRSMTGPLTTHEMTHALEDQHYDIDARMDKVLDDDDAVFAISSVAEGSASLTMAVAMARAMSSGAIDQDGLREMADSEAGRAKKLDAMPDVLRRQLLGPYVLGALFLAKGDLAKAANGYPQADAAAVWAKLPRSSEQILHPEKYWDPAHRDEPRDVKAPDLAGLLGDGWHLAGEGVLGELTIGALVGVPPVTSRVVTSGSTASAWTNAAASGWGGDRFALYTKGKEALVVLASVWDSEKDAREFAEALPKRSNRAFGRNGDEVFVVAGGTETQRREILRFLLPNPR